MKIFKINNSKLYNHNSNIVKSLKNDIIHAYILFIFSIIVRYFFQSIIGDVFFVSLLFIFLIYKKNYFYLAFLFILIDPPGYLFYERGLYHLPQINLGTFERSIFYDEIFVLFAILKSFIIKEKGAPLFYRKQFIALILYIVFLFLITYLFGTNLFRLLRAIRFVIPFTLFLVIPKLLKEKHEFIRFTNILFAFVPIIFFAQLFDIIYGNPIASFLGEYNLNFAGTEYDTTSQQVFDISKGPIRSIYSVSIIIYTFIAGLFYLKDNETILNKKYLSIIVGLLYLSVLLCATRGWIIAFSFILFLFIIMSNKNPKYIIVSFFIIFILIFTIPILKTQLILSFKRVETIEKLLEGDITAGGTLSRLSERGPRVMNKFKESPLFGFGYSNEFFNYMDGHVGNQTLLLNGGILGFIVYLIFIGNFILKMLLSNLSRKYNNLRILAIGILGIIVLHSSSAMIFSFITSPALAMSLALIFALANQYYYYYRGISSGLNEFRGKESLP